MIIPSTIVFFIPVALLLLVIPGPAVIFITSRSIILGRRAGLVSVLGIEMANFTIALLAAAGLSVILLESAMAFDIVKYLGAGYLFYLGIRTLLRKKNVKPHSDISTSKSPNDKGMFSNAFLVGILNPKTILFFYAFLPQFVVSGAGSATVQILFFGVIFVLMGACTDGLYAIFAASTKELISRRFPRMNTGAKYISAGAYIALGLAAATSNIKSG